MKKLSSEDYIISNWSGGRTIQIAIHPEGALYADREFDWRLSSATCELEESDFTLLPDYERLITPLDGRMELTHRRNDAPGDGETEPAFASLEPYRIHRFDGADLTHCVGRCTDFNLMLRKGRCRGELIPLIALEGGEPQDLSEMLREALPETTREAGTVILYCTKGSMSIASADGQTLELQAGESACAERGETDGLSCRFAPGSRALAAVIIREN